MEDIPTADARKNLAELLNRVAYGKERFVVTRHGKELAALVPLEDMDLLERARRTLARKEVQLALEEAGEADRVSWRALKHDMGL